MINMRSMNCYKCSRIVSVCVSVFVSKTKCDDNYTDCQCVMCLFDPIFNIRWIEVQFEASDLLWLVELFLKLVVLIHRNEI